MFKIAKKLMGIASSTGKKTLIIDLLFYAKIDGVDHQFNKRTFSPLEAITFLKNMTPELTDYNELTSYEYKAEYVDKFKNIFAFFTIDDKNMLIKNDGTLTKDFIMNKIEYSDSKGRKLAFDDVNESFKTPAFINTAKIIKKAKSAMAEAEINKKSK
jgi:hypothetical protein